MANRVEARRLPDAAPVRFLKLLWGAGATLLSVLYTVVLAVVVAVLATLGRYHAACVVSRLWARLIIRTCGVKVEILGLEHLQGLKSYVLTANHQSFFDIFAVIAYMPGDTRFVAKKELLRIPLIGYTMKTVGHVIVDRRGGGHSIRHALGQARNNYPICVFAEGHRFNDGRVHQFNDGAAWLAIAARLPCVPMAISGSGAFFPREAKVVVPGGRMRMRLCAPVPTVGLRSADRENLTRKLEETVRAAFEPEILD